MRNRREQFKFLAPAFLPGEGTCIKELLDYTISQVCALLYIIQEKWDNKEDTLNISYEPTHLKEGNSGGGTSEGTGGVCEDVARPLANIFQRHLHLHIK